MRAAAVALTVQLLALPGGVSWAQGEDHLVLAGQLDCGGKATQDAAGVPKNALLIVFDEGDLNEPWMLRDKAGIVAAVNQLLSFYTMDSVRAREYSKEEASRFFSEKTQNHDVMIDYASNSFLVELRNGCPYAGNTTGWAVCKAADCGADDEIFGPETRHYAQESCVRGFAPFSGFAEAEGAARARAYLAALIVHEVIHAAHMRVLGDLLAREPASPPKPCVPDIPLSVAKKQSSAVREKLGLPKHAMHMSNGLMTAGIDLTGKPEDEAGGYSPNMGQCLSDPKVPASLFRDMRALASSNVLCTDSREPVTKFFYFPAMNVALINRHLTKAAAAGCHAACYYRLQKAPKAPR